jgi:hypothetical protein
MSNQIFRWISEVGILSDFIPLIILLIVFKKVHRYLWWTLFCIAFSWLLSDGLTWFFARKSMNTYIIYNCYAIVSTCFYVLLFYNLNQNHSFRKVLIVVSSLYVIFSVWYITFTQSWFKPVPIIDVFTGLLPLILSLLFFYELFKSLRVPNLLKYSYYWINTAVMVHFGVTFFAYIFMEVLYQKESLFQYIYLIIIISNFVYNILFARGLWLMKRI